MKTYAKILGEAGYLSYLPHVMRNANTQIMSDLERREKLRFIFDTVKLRSFTKRGRKMGLTIPMSYELPHYNSLDVLISDSLEEGHLCDGSEMNVEVNAWYKEAMVIRNSFTQNGIVCQIN